MPQASIKLCFASPGHRDITVVIVCTQFYKRQILSFFFYLCICCELLHDSVPFVFQCPPAVISLLLFCILAHPLGGG